MYHHYALNWTLFLKFLEHLFGEFWTKIWKTKSKTTYFRPEQSDFRLFNSIFQFDVVLRIVIASTFFGLRDNAWPSSSKHFIKCCFYMICNTSKTVVLRLKVESFICVVNGLFFHLCQFCFCLTDLRTVSGSLKITNDTLYCFVMKKRNELQWSRWSQKAILG